MTLFYDPNARKPKKWVFVVFVVLPVVICLLVVYFGSKKVAEKREQARQQGQSDIFNNF